ncbi:portal (connector) protein [Enterobacter phage 04_vB_Eclo_IJM]|nr:portal (connector) protein [Enterobacter phage 04_vB_Eclo_IJM]
MLALFLRHRGCDYCQSMRQDPEQDTEAAARVDEGLAMVERVLMAYMEMNSFRVPLFEALSNLSSGNCLLYIPPPEQGQSQCECTVWYPMWSSVMRSATCYRLSPSTGLRLVLCRKTFSLSSMLTTMSRTPSWMCTPTSTEKAMSTCDTRKWKA